MKKFALGFTLIELMIVVVVIGIIAAFAYPAYMDYVRKARRADAQATLMANQIAQERYRAYNNVYASTAVILDAAGLGITESDKYYEYKIASVASSTYTLSAILKAGSDQINDTGCYPLTVDQGNTKEPASCWKR